MPPKITAAHLMYGTKLQTNATAGGEHSEPSSPMVSPALGRKGSGYGGRRGEARAAAAQFEGLPPPAEESGPSSSPRAAARRSGSVKERVWHSAGAAVSKFSSAVHNWSSTFENAYSGRSVQVRVLG